MSNVLEKLYDYKLFKFFEEISHIPRGSGNRKPIADYCEQFAKERNLEYFRDDFDNIVITKEATKAGNSKTVIIQGHLDMVAEKESDSTHNFETDPLKLIVDGDFISADKTTLGGDDGIAVAYALALLDDKQISHPRLKVVLTADEEIGLLGAGYIDEKLLEGDYLLNIDSEEEGYFLNSCAGGVSFGAKVAYKKINNDYSYSYEINVEGLFGGHSGAEIHKNRGNAAKLLGNLLCFLREKTDFSISYIDGGKKDNAIMRNAKVTLCANDDICDYIRVFNDNIKLSLANIDSNVNVSFNKCDNPSYVMDNSSLDKLITMLVCTPNGVLQFEETQTHYVQTSINLGILTMTDESVELGYSIRSSIDFMKENVLRELKHLCNMSDVDYTVSGEYPGWAVNNNSELAQIMKEVFVEQYGRDPVIQGIHAGLECGIFYKKNPKLDIISFGPDIFDIHTPKEHLSISSTIRVWEFITRVLNRLV